jgi:hypothetical protein
LTRNYFPFLYLISAAVLVVALHLGRGTPALSIQAEKISKIAPTKMTERGLEVLLSGNHDQALKLGKILSKYSNDRLMIEAPQKDLQSAYRVELALFDQGVSSDKLEVAGITSRDSVVVVIQS